MKMRIAMALLLCVGVLTAWLFFSEKQPMPICGVADPPMEERERMLRADSMRAIILRDRFGVLPDLRNGEKVFKGNCASCHKPDMDMTGPALKGLLDRTEPPALERYLTFLLHEDSLVTAGDPYTIKLRQHWGNSQWMHPLGGLERKDLIDVLAYCESWGPPAVVKAVP